MTAKKTNPKKSEIVEGATNEANTELVAYEKEIEKELVEANPEVFKGLNPKQKSQLVRTITSISIVKSHSGPLPPPEQLEHYNSIIEKGAERIMIMAENQSSHRMGLENFAIKKQIGQSGMGQIFGFIIALICIGCGVYLTMNGHDAVGGILLGTTMVSLVGIFVVGKILQKNKD
nr:DUF2335 domain-containing protein [uncultured Flavobacterium sp.]